MSYLLLKNDFKGIQTQNTDLEVEIDNFVDLAGILKFTFHSDFSGHSLRTDLFALRLLYSPVETEFQGATRGALHKRPLFTYARSYLTSRGRESASNWRIGNFASQRAFVFYVTIFTIEVVEI